MCPECGSRNTKKNGKPRGIQWYRCIEAGHSFQSTRRPERKQRALLHKYVWGRQSLAQLAETNDRSIGWIRNQLEHAERIPETVTPEKIVIAADVTFWGREYGVCVFRSPTLKRNLWAKEVTEETVSIYAEGYAALGAKGWIITAAVIDGRAGVVKVFQGIPVQICQFHQVKTVGRYLTRHPKLPAARELWYITLKLTESTEEQFTKLLEEWHKKWEEFLDEYTLCAICHRKHYTHRRIRSAYRSLKLNMPHLFTYQKYPELRIPNTTNCLDGMFSQLKNRLNVHRGAGREFRYKLIQEILGGEGTTA